MGNYEAWSGDGRYGMRMPFKILQKMAHLCKKVKNVETGGILVGYYNRRHNCAIVTESSAPPEDSESGKSFFYRGIKGLQQWLARLWQFRRRRYYLGEWHFHPNSNPTPSNVDIQQIKSNAENRRYACPEPIMFIIGGGLDADWAYKSFVYIRDKGLIELFRGWENDDT